MSESVRIGVVVGSLRAGSISRKVAHALMKRAPRTLACRLIEIGDLPLYNEDLDTGSPPPAWQRFRSEVRAVDGLLFVTPEYNRSIPGCLKNALDVGSRPEKASVFDGMPAGVVSVTPYKLGAFGANHAIRQTFVFLNMPVLQQPEMYLGNGAELVGDDGAFKNESTCKLADGFISAFERWVRRLREGASPSFDEFMQKRRDVARDYVNGDATSLREIVTSVDPATFFSPGGDVVRGASTISARYDHDAKMFGKGGTTNLEILQSGASGGLAFWTGLQHAEARLGDKVVPMTLRVTEVYRVENGALKLVHRHADTGSKPKPG